MLLSIVIPTFNRQSELSKLLTQLKKECIGEEESVEILVSSNCSTDQTDLIVQEHINSKSDTLAIQYFKQPSNIGAIKNLNFLIRKSQAKYIWSLGDDDALVNGKLHEIIKALRGNSIKLLLIRAQGIYEWDIISRNINTYKTNHILEIPIQSKGSADYLLAGGFLGSTIIDSATWKSILPQVEYLHDTCYSNWASVLQAALIDKKLHVLDEPCVKGNFNMAGESAIPSFNVLVMGRVKVWLSLRDTPIFNLLLKNIKKIVLYGWVSVATGQSNDIKTTAEKLHTLKSTILLMRLNGIPSYIVALASIIFPFPTALNTLLNTFKTIINRPISLLTR